METYILSNPLSGNGRGGISARDLAERIGGEIRFIDITTVKDLPGLLLEIPQGAKIILCGGDGTLQHFATDAPEAAKGREILYFATGSGNDFMNDLERKPGTEPFVLNQYLADLPYVMIKGVTYRFLNGIGYGLDGYCCEVADVVRQKSGKKINYPITAFKGLMYAYNPTEAEVTVDGETRTYRKVWLAPCMNGRYFGGGIKIAPGQDRLNAERRVTSVVVHSIGRLHCLCLFPSIFSGKHVKYSQAVDIRTGFDVRVRFDRPTAIQIDGETILGVEEYRVVSAAVKHEEN